MNRYTFKVRGFDRVEEFAETRSKARYKLWLRFSDAYPCSFADFLKKCT